MGSQRFPPTTSTYAKGFIGVIVYLVIDDTIDDLMHGD